MKRLLVIALALAALTASAQDAAKVNPHTVTVTLDNENVRVLDSTLPPGAREAMHSHPATILYVVSGGKVRNHTADGRTTETLLKDGDTVYREPLTHWAENIGDKPIHVILVELKPKQ
jgi:quercetin dioxygenase-like cupin family protein